MSTFLYSPAGRLTKSLITCMHLLCRVGTHGEGLARQQGLTHGGKNEQGSALPKRRE